MTKVDILKHLTGLAPYENNRPYFLSFGFYEGKCEPSGTTMAVSSMAHLVESFIEFDKPKLQASFKADAVYTIGVEATKKKKKHEENLEKAVDLILATHTAKIKKTIAFYEKALKDIGVISGL